MIPSTALSEIEYYYGSRKYLRASKRIPPRAYKDPELARQSPRGKYGAPDLETFLDLVTRFGRLATLGLFPKAVWCRNDRISVQSRSLQWEPLEMITWKEFEEMIELAEGLEAGRKSVGREEGGLSDREVKRQKMLSR